MKEKQNLLETETFWTIFWIILGCIGITVCIYIKFFSPGVPKSQQIECKRIILSEFPDFENGVKKLIKEKHPRMLGVYRWQFRKTKIKNIIIARYGIFGGDWLEQVRNVFIEIITLGLFNPGGKEAVFYSVQVNLNDKSAVLIKEK